MKTDVKEKIIRYPITSQSFRYVDIYHQGIETFTAITCCYQKEEETKELQYVKIIFLFLFLPLAFSPLNCRVAALLATP